VAVYTISFIPNADTLRFRYCFGSEEYPEYACSQFNDVFGFFIQGPGYPTFTNIAKVPGTNLPVSINTIHPANPAYAPCPPFNVQYYRDNNNAAQQPVYDGFTTVLTAMAVVTPCQQYTIKLAIADVGDSAYDSGVFLEAKSFGTGSLRVAATSTSPDGVMAEGCAEGTITFTLPEIRGQDFPIVYNVFGTANQGVDYPNLPTDLIIPAGQTTITIPVVPFEDGLSEPLESIGISVQVDPCNRDTVYLFIRDKILLPPVMQDQSVCVANSPVQLDATVPTQVPPPPTFTNSTPYPIPNGGAPVNSSISVVGVQPPILGPGVIRSVCLNVQHPWVDDLDIYLIAPNGVVLELTTDNGGDGDNYTNTCFTPTATTLISSPGPFAPPSAAPFTGDWLPEGPWSDLWGGPANGTWRLRVTDDQNGFNGTLLNWSMTFEPVYNVTYQWSPATGLSCTDCPDPVATPAQNTIYTVTATDSYGCTITESVEVSIGSVSAQANIIQPIKCFGQKGSVEVQSPGTNTYLWSTGQTTSTLTNLDPGTYTVTVTNVGAGICTTTSSVTLVQPTELFATAAPQGVSCFGFGDGSAAVHPTGGTMPYSYVWNTGATLDSISNLTPGLYTVTVTDNNGCTKISTMNVVEPTAIQIVTALNRSPSCFGLSDGQLTTYAVGGTTPFTFVWNTGQLNQGITNIAAGTYTVTATDGNGCTQEKTETVTEPALLTNFVTPEAVKCFGQNSGKLNMDVAGGTPPYSAVWSGPNAYTGTGLNIANLFAGVYSATVTDSKGCTSTATVNLNQPAELTVVLPAIADTICFFGTNGTATATPSGGTSPYSYVWSANNQTAQTATGLSSNEYFVTITDANGCKTTGKTFVMQQQELNAFGQAQPPRCHNGLDGTASMISIFYGATPADLSDFTFNWNTSPPKSGLTVNGLVGGQTYTVTATDALGCTATASVPVPNPFPIETAITGKTDANCFGSPTGTASAKAIGGTSPYTWLWNGGVNPTDSLVQGLTAGVYVVTIMDSYGCPGTSSVTIGQPTQLKVQTQATDVKCFGESTGIAKAIPSGGTAPYQFLWDNGAQTAEVGQLPKGVYSLSVTDANGCLTPTFVEIGQPDTPLSGLATMEPPRCFGGHDGRITLAGAGGTPPYRYGLGSSPFNGSSVQIGIKAGYYTPKIMDINGCELTLAPIEVTQPAPISVDLGPDIRILFGEDTQLGATVQNAQGTVTYAWRQEDSPWLNCMDCPDPEVVGLEFSNHFELVVTDEKGCRAEDQVLVSVEKPRKVHVPTGFTPNSDFANDRLVVHGQSTARVVEFKVFDRWGEMVFQQKDYAFNDETQGWDGTFRGQPCDPGVYVWVLEVEYSDGVREVFKGNTTLIR
jgi:gliding motility-associated-like protein